MSLHLSWSISALIILALAVWAGYAARKNLVGILIDTRGRFSLNHLQIVMWTVIILSSIVGVFLARLVAGEADLMHFAIPQELLILMGISVGSATSAGAVKAAKDIGPSAPKIARVGAVFPVAARARLAQALAGGAPAAVEHRTIEAHFSQVVQEEEGDQGDVSVDVTKFQNLVFTALAGIAYVVLFWSRGTIDALPPLPNELLWLLGISHAGYVAGKLPAKP